MTGADDNTTNVAGMIAALEKLDFECFSFKTNAVHLSDISLPVILLIENNHYVILYKLNDNYAYISDPLLGIRKIPLDKFYKLWELYKEGGLIISATPSKKFYKTNNFFSESKKLFLTDTKFFSRFRFSLLSLFFIIIINSVLIFLLPYLNQDLFDKGIKNNAIDIVKLIIGAQFLIYVGQNISEFFRTWILTRMGNKINLHLTNNFLNKILSLPIIFFENKSVGDIVLRFADHNRIFDFITVNLFNLVFSILNIIIFGVILINYNFKIFLFFFIGSIISYFWIMIFFKRRKLIETEKFTSLSLSQTSLVQYIWGIMEIKLNSNEKVKQKEWNTIQEDLYNLNIRTLKMNQLQREGNAFITQARNLIVTYLAAVEVINGNISIGMMISINYIIGQLNAPFEQLTGVFQNYQDMKISAERVHEYYGIKSEVLPEDQGIKNYNTDADIKIRDLSYFYESNPDKIILKNLSFDILKNKTTAIVGYSGSGKTTLLKLLLKLYSPKSGNILLEDTNLNNIDTTVWRNDCGSVMQNGFIFTNTVLNNITLEANENVNFDLLNEVLEICQINEFISSFPNGINTKIGYDGVNLSAGQRQRLLIARALYKNPKFVFLDEATSSLDAKTEEVIINNLESFLKQRTSVIIAHRLTTIRKSDQIIVLNNGEIIEKGNHESLIHNKNFYYNLIKNQINLN
jgi:ATP-binding cassette subfamily B protein